MKSGLILAALAQLAAAQPHRAHLHQHKRDVQYVTDVEIVTAPAAIVFVNAQGVPVSTEFPAGAAATGVATSVVVAETVPTPTATVAASSVPAAAAAHGSESSGSKGSKGSTGSTGSTGNSGVGMNGFGIAYSPYNSDGTCKSQGQVNSDFEQINGYSYVRIYGVDCSQVATVGNAAKAKGMKMMAGIYDINAVQTELSTLMKDSNNDFSHISWITIGNEVVNSGIASPGQVVDAINQARGILKSTSFAGQIATVDTFNQLEKYPELCQNSDFAGANIHAFFDADVPAANAGNYVKSTAEDVKKACGGKEVIVTESGYPYSGQSNGAAIPSVINQQAALASLKLAFADTKNLFLYSAFDNAWQKNNAGTFGTEQFWGFLSHDESL